jgi:hypothetical protein
VKNLNNPSSKDKIVMFPKRILFQLIESLHIFYIFNCLTGVTSFIGKTTIVEQEKILGIELIVLNSSIM